MTDRAEPNAILLPATTSGSLEAHAFPGMPGRYLPGEPVLLRTVDLTVEEARSLIKDLGVPLELVDHGKRREADPVPDENPPRDKGEATAEPEELTPQAPINVEPPAAGGPGHSPIPAVADTAGGSK